MKIKTPCLTESDDEKESNRCEQSLSFRLKIVSGLSGDRKLISFETRRKFRQSLIDIKVSFYESLSDVECALFVPPTRDIISID